MSFEKYVAILGLIATIPVYKGWMMKAWQWNNSRRISALEKHLDLITKLHNETNFLIIYIGQSLLVVLGLMSASQVYEVMNVAIENRKISSIFISLISLIAYIVAIYRLGVLTKVRKFEESSKKIVAAINRVKPNKSSKKDVLKRASS